MSDARREDWPECIIDLRGTPSGITGSFACSGGSVFAAVHRSISFQPGSFSIKAVRVEERSCERPGCLITICRDSQAIIRATVSNITVSGEKLPSIFCLSGGSDVYFSQSLFIGNKATAVL